MKKAKVTVCEKIRVKMNTVKNSNGQKYAVITQDKPFGRILHTGQTDYIKRVARKKYNVNVEF